MENEISMEDKNSTFVVLPAYNEATRIRPVLKDIARKGTIWSLLMMVLQTILWKSLNK